MKQKLEIDKIRDRIYEDLQPSGWGRVLRTFIYSSDFDNILHSLVVEVNAGNRFTPPLKDVFRAFKECPYEELKVVIIGQDPYPTIDVADGIAFSCSKSKTPGQIQPSLKFILQEVNRTVYNSEYVSYNPDLARWSNQGILMLNTALTTQIGKIGKHYEIWKPLLNYLFDYLKLYNPSLVYIFMGKEAKNWEDTVGETCHKYFCSHPASAVYNTKQVWDCNNVFNNTSEIVKELHNFDIIW